MKKMICFLFCLLTTTIVFGQNSIAGKLIDSLDNKPLALATVSLYRASDTTLIAYKLSSNNGEFVFTNLPTATTFRLIVSYSGYMVVRKEFGIAENEKKDLGNILMEATAKSLDEVLVIAERPPVVYRKDTVEFNANAFKTLPNAVVEDLLKKLPGVQVDKEGNILVNGKRVNKITVDGKNFFGGDPKTASRNLPSNVIDKVQVMDDEEELLGSENSNKNNVGKVINLTFKKGYKKGMFGKAYAGEGTSKRYEAGAIANIFKDTLQASFIAYSNNLNRPGFGFNELMQTGGMARTRNVTNNSQTSMNNEFDGSSSITINGVNMGGKSQLGGVSTSSGAGINVNHSPNKKQSVYAQYFYGDINTKVNQTSLATTSTADSVLTLNENSFTLSKSISHFASAGINLKPDSVTQVIAYANFTKGLQNTNINNITNASQTNTGNLSNGSSIRKNDFGTENFREQFSFSRFSKKKKGQRFYFLQTYQITDKANDFATDGVLHLIIPSSYDSLFNRLRSERTKLNYLTLYGLFSLPISKQWTLGVSARQENENFSNKTNSFVGNKVPDLDFSNALNRTSSSQNLQASIQYKWKELSIKPGIRWQAQYFKTNLVAPPKQFKQTINKVLPSLNIVYKNFSLDYSRDIQLPTYNYIIPVSDNSNPYLINQGNVALESSLKDNFSLYYNDYDPKAQMNIWGGIWAYRADKDVASSVSISPTGVQTVMPINADNVHSLTANFGLSKQYKTKSTFSHGWNVGTYTQMQKTPYIFNNVASVQRNRMVNIWFLYNLNWNDELEWNFITAMNDKNLKNSAQGFEHRSFGLYTGGTEVVLRKLKHIAFETQMDYMYNSAVQDKSQRGQWFWRAAVNFTLGKNEQSILRLGASDILNQLKSTYASLNQNTVRISNVNLVGQYFMATYTYNLRQTGTKGKVGGIWSL